MRVPFSSPPGNLRFLITGLAGLGLATGLSACGSGHDSPQAGGQQQMQGQAARVEIMTAKPTSISSERVLPARATPFAEAEIRPQVTGLIQKRLFTEGEQVEEGQALYQIEPSEYEAAVESARASLARAEATAQTASETAKRYERLSNTNAISRQAYDEAIAAQKEAEAEVGIQKAALQQARINLARTVVRSPIAGQIGRSSVTQGALVTANQATALARVLQLDPIYIDMTAASTEVLKWRQDVAAGKVKTSGNTDAVPVTVRFENGTVYEHTGKLEFSEVSVDQDAGTVIVRAQVPNPEGFLLPGMFVKAAFSAGTYDNAFLIPQKAVQRTPRGEPMVYVVNAEGMAEQRKIVTQGTEDTNWIVSDGLEAGDRVVTGGLQSLRAGMPVEVVTSEAVAVTAMHDTSDGVEPE